MDNAQYGDDTPRSADAARRPGGRDAASCAACCKPGGTLYVTVPYGEPADLGWQRIFDAAGLDEIVAAFGPAPRERARVLPLHRDGLAALDRRRGRRRGLPRPLRRPGRRMPDRAVAARAIACLTLRT